MTENTKNIENVNLNHLNILNNVLHNYIHIKQTSKMHI